MEYKYVEGMPLAPAQMINPLTNSRTKHLALIDSGSDWCSLPKELWDKLEFKELGLLELGTPLGWQEAGFSWCNLKLAHKEISIEIHYNFGPEILIGRNAMKYFLIAFDGKREKLTIS